MCRGDSLPGREGASRVEPIREAWARYPKELVDSDERGRKGEFVLTRDDVNSLAGMPRG